MKNQFFLEFLIFWEKKISFGVLFMANPTNNKSRAPAGQKFFWHFNRRDSLSADLLQSVKRSYFPLFTSLCTYFLIFYSKKAWNYINYTISTPKSHSQTQFLTKNRGFCKFENFLIFLSFLRKSPLLAFILASEPRDMVPRPQHEPLNMLGIQSQK